MPRHRRYVHRDAKFTSYDLGQNWSWDWCLCFRVRSERDARAHYERSGGYTMRGVVERLELAGLETKLYRSYDRTHVFVKVRASLARLKEEAARTGYPLMLAPDEVQRRVEEQLDEAEHRRAVLPRRPRVGDGELGARRRRPRRGLAGRRRLDRPDLPEALLLRRVPHELQQRVHERRGARGQAADGEALPPDRLDLPAEVARGFDASPRRRRAVEHGSNVVLGPRRGRGRRGLARRRRRRPQRLNHPTATCYMSSI